MTTTAPLTARLAAATGTLKLSPHDRICGGCGHLVDRREAAVRSVSLERVYYHPACAAVGSAS